MHSLCDGLTSTIMDAAIIEKEALRLSESQRALLADRLLQSLSKIPLELQTAWIQEVDSRMEAFREGKISAVDGQQAIAELRALFPR